MARCSILLLAIVAGCGGGRTGRESPSRDAAGFAPRIAWANPERLDYKRWGEACGEQDVDRPVVLGSETRTWSSPIGRPSDPRSPLTVCHLDYDADSHRVTGMALLMSSYDDVPLTRPVVERLLGEIVLPYLPPDARSVVQEMAFIESTGIPERRTVGAFKLESSWNPGSMWSIRVGID